MIEMPNGGVSTSFEFSFYGPAMESRIDLFII